MGLLLVLESNKVAVLIIQEIESVVEGHFQVELRVREATFAHNVFARINGGSTLLFKEKLMITNIFLVVFNGWIQK